MECSGSCRQFCLWIEEMPYHRKYVLPKEIYPQLPECFNETFLGEMAMGACRQLRGPHGAHIHEFEDRWVLHRDHVDADEDPLGHLLRDAPEYLTSLAVAVLTGLAFTHRRKQGRRGQVALASSLVGALALVAGKAFKLLDGEEMEERSERPEPFQDLGKRRS